MAFGASSFPRMRPVGGILRAAVFVPLMVVSTVASSAVTYVYRYTGNTFGDETAGAGFYIGPYEADDFVSLTIRTFTPLTAGTHDQLSTPGLSFVMGDGDLELTYRPEVETYPGSEATISYFGNIFVYELEPAGVPVAWNIALTNWVQYDFRTYSATSISSQHWWDEFGVRAVDEAIRGTRQGWYDLGVMHDFPGTWTLETVELTELSEPNAAALTGLGLAGLFAAGAMRRRTGNLKRAHPQSRE